MSRDRYCEYCVRGRRMIKQREIEELRAELGRLKQKVKRIQQIRNRMHTQKLVTELSKAKRKLEAEYFQPSH